MTVFGLAGSATAEPVTLNGITFSDEMGGVVLLQGWGSGQLDDPFVLVEDITDTGPAILTIRGLTPSFGNHIGSHHLTGFALTKIVRNRTTGTWPTFSLELREFLGFGSHYGDGLSFGQATTIGRPFLSDGYSESQEMDEPFDVVSFSDGAVHPGELIMLSVVVTDFTPKPVFYLLQRQETPMAGLPTGAPADSQTASKLALR